MKQRVQKWVDGGVRMSQEKRSEVKGKRRVKTW